MSEPYWVPLGGPLGSAGAAGAPGERWFTGSGAPTGTLSDSIVGDWYLDSVSGDYYEKSGATTWTLRGNLKGPTGAAGSTGVATLVSNLWGPYFPFPAFGTGAFTAGAFRGTRVVVPQAVKAVALECTTITGSTTCVVAAYADNMGIPGALVAQSAALTFSSAAVVQAPITLPAGTYWIAVQNTGLTQVTLRNVSGANPFLNGLATPAAGGALVINALNVGSQGTSVPGSWPAGTAQISAAIAVWLQAT